MEEKIIVPKRILSSLISSLSAGVVPRLGAPYVAIGREAEVTALLSDLKLITEGGSTLRFIIGRYGSGKSFLMQLMRGYALERGYVTCDCDLSPERRLCGGKGSGVATYRELMKNMATKTSPEGGALSSVLSKWLSGLMSEAAAGGLTPNTEAFNAEVEKKVYSVLSETESSVGGFDFAHIVKEYYHATVIGDDAKKSMCLRWLRGEYTTKTEARGDLSVGSIIDDENWYDYVKLFADFVRKTSYFGFVIFIDECVNLFKIPNRIGRENNYEKILAMFNDTCQGRAPGLSIIMGGTPEFLEDRRRGLFSYEALRSRLADGRFAAAEGYTDMLGPVIRLKKLSPSEMLALISRVTKLHRQYYDWEPPITEENEITFLSEISARVGANIMITPREIIRDWLSVLNVLMQYKDVSFNELVKKTASEGVSASTVGETQNNDFSLDDIEI